MLAGLSATEREQLADLLRRFLVALGRVPDRSGVDEASEQLGG